MLKWLFVFFISGIIVFTVTLFFKLGGNKPVQIEMFDAPGYHLIYKEHAGSYHKISGKIEEVEQWAIMNNIPCTKTFGLYLDNPETVEEMRLRSQGGCITNKQISTLPKGFFYKYQPPQKYLKGTFKGSPAIGPFKVYPKAKEWFANQRLKQTGPTLEIYTVISSEKVTTEYLFPLSGK